MGEGGSAAQQTEVRIDDVQKTVALRAEKVMSAAHFDQLKFPPSELTPFHHACGRSDRIIAAVQTGQRNIESLVRAV